MAKSFRDRGAQILRDAGCYVGGALGRRGIHAFGGNMPFLGGRRIASEHGERYCEWLTQIYGGTGDTDYVGYFFHPAADLMAPAGGIGFIATNAIADGDNALNASRTAIAGSTATLNESVPRKRTRGPGLSKTSASRAGTTGRRLHTR